MTVAPSGSGSPPPPAPVPREKELLIGRVALRKQWIAAPRLVEALLVQSAGGAKKPIGEILVERGDLTPERLDELLALQAATRKAYEDEEPGPPKDVGPDMRIGKVIAGIRIDARVDKRDLWVSFVGRRPNDPEPVTLKLVDIAALRNGLWIDFLETVRACVPLKSPNVTPVLEVTRADGSFAIVTRYSEGFTLQTLLDKVRRIRLSEALRIGKEAAKGLRDLHKAGLVHRAFRPSAVWLPRKGAIAVQDAGLAFEPTGVRVVAAKGTIFGSPHHMAPEVAQGDIADARSDTYALGAVLYEMVTGVKPFEGFGVIDLITQHLNQAPLPPHKFIGDVPAPVGAFLLSLLAKKKEDRPADDAVVAELEKLEAAAPKPGLTQTFKKPEG